MKIIYIIVFVVLLGSYSFAQDTQHKCHDEDGKWKFELSPGAWNTAIKGTITANDLPGYINVSLSDKFKSPDFSYFTEFEARKGKFIIIGQFTSINQTGDGSFTQGPYGHSHSTVRPLFLSGGLAFDFYENDEVVVQFFGGARWNYIRNEIETELVSGGSQKEKQSKGFIDPLLGLRFEYKPFKSRALKDLHMKMYFDIGGYGMVSFLSFQSYAALGYEFNKNFSLRLGYRYLDVHYGKDSYSYNVGIQGFEFVTTTRF
jgi:hypothetical protein